jgi:TonB family protein
VPREEIRRGRRGNGVGLLITLALHGGVLAAVGVAHSTPAPPVIENRSFVAAEMVKLGKPRDKFWLPRITQPPPPQAPPDRIKVAEDPNAAPTPKEAPKPEDAKISNKLKNALKRAQMLEKFVEEEQEVGEATGSRFGTSDHAVGDQYEAELKGMLQQNYNLPAGMAPDQISTPPVISFRLSEDGTVGDVKLMNSSGNPLVDDACVNAAKLTRKVTPPPPTYKKRKLGVSCEK